VIIANGRLVTQSSLDDLGARSSSAVRVRTPQADQLRAALAVAGVATEPVADDTLLAWNTSTEAVGLAAAGAGAVIYEMSTEQLDLEELFLELTTARETVS
jgi:ABC-2 type transport system ATP-binding protein